MANTAAVKKVKMKKSRQDWILDIIIYTLSVIILFATVYPFYYVFMLSFNEGMDASLGGIYWFPRKFTLTNYSKFFTDWKWVRASSRKVPCCWLSHGVS